MPLLADSDYRSPWWLPGGHLQTIIPALTRRAGVVTLWKERLELEDGDFLDLEWYRQDQIPSRKLAILCHGLEANARATYLQEVAGALAGEGWDILAWSYRGCSGEMNRLPGFYHSGASYDLSAVLDHALENHPASQIDLVGFSLGGNLILKYLGERAGAISARVGRAVTFSVPCDLACSAEALDTAFNREVYMRRFVRSLSDKIHRKHALFPDQLDRSGLVGIRTFREFDSRYTAPLHGFRDAEDYWRRSSSKPFLASITIPTLLVNAANDPFLGPKCYPQQAAESSKSFYLEVPADGGHVGFPSRGGSSWLASRTLSFLQDESAKKGPVSRDLR